MSADPTGERQEYAQAGALPIEQVLAEVHAERIRQDVKWGQQNHPNGTGPDYSYHRDVARQQCEDHGREGTVTYLDILGEEVYEAFAEDDPARLREELIQVAAVAVAWIETIDRRAALTALTEGGDDHPKFTAFKNKRLQNPAVTAAYEEAKARRDERARGMSDHPDPLTLLLVRELTRPGIITHDNGTTHVDAGHLATALRDAGLITHNQEAATWDDGYNAGHRDALVVDPDHTDPTPNPHRRTNHSTTTTPPPCHACGSIRTTHNDGTIHCPWCKTSSPPAPDPRRDLQREWGDLR